jgi:hypothetical protein
MVESGQRQEPEDVGLRADDGHLAASIAGSHETAHESAEAGGVHEADALQIDGDVGVPVRDERIDALLELRRRIEIDFTTDRKDHPRPNGLRVEFEIDRSHLLF